MDVTAEIRRMKIAGYGMQDTYIYVRDYIELDQFVHLWEGFE